MNYLRLLKHERGLIVSALVLGGAAVGLGVPIDFVLFGLMLAGIAIFHHHTLQVALTGLAAIVVYELASGGSMLAPASKGPLHLAHEGHARESARSLLGFALLRSTSKTRTCRRKCREYVRAAGTARSCCSRWYSFCRRSSTTSPRR
jgi:hypothetical protein